MDRGIVVRRARWLLLVTGCALFAGCTADPAPGRTPTSVVPTAAGPEAALLTESDVPEGFQRLRDPRRIGKLFFCHHDLGSLPPGADLIGMRAYQQAQLGRYEQMVAAALSAPANRYLSRVTHAVKSCSRFERGRGASARTYTVRLSNLEGIGRRSISVVVTGTGALPDVTSYVFAYKSPVLMRITVTGGGSPVDLRLAQSLAIRAFDRI